MYKSKKSKPGELSFEHRGHHATLHTEAEQVTLTLDGNQHKLRQLDNGRPFSSAFVTVMAKDTRHYVELFIDHIEVTRAFFDAQNGHCHDHKGHS